MDFYDKINKLLKEKKIKKNKMCEDLDIPYNTIMSMFSRKSKSISIDVIEMIADYLEVSVDYLVRKDINDTQFGIEPLLQTNIPDITTPKEKNLINNYRKLNENGQKKAIEYIDDLTDTERYTKKYS